MIDLTSQMTYRIGNLDIQNQRISYQMSTGKVLQNGSDDSVLYGKYLNIESNLRVYEGLELQIQKTTAQNNVSDASIGELKHVIDTIKVDLLKSLNAGMTRADRVSVAKNMEGMRANLISLVNTQIDGEFIFAGSNTTIQTASKDVNFKINGQVNFNGNSHLRNISVEPNTYRQRGVTASDVIMYNTDTSAVDGAISFTEHEKVVDENGNSWKLNAAKTQLVKYKEDGTISQFVDSTGALKDEYITIATSTGTPLRYTTNTIDSAKPADPANGSETISSNTASGLLLEAKHNIFDDMNIIINALYGYKTIENDTALNGEKGALATDVEVRDILSNGLEKISEQFNAMNVGHAELGGRNKIFEVALERITSKITHYNILMQKTNGVNMAKLAMESKSLELTYNALYSTVSKMNELSLINFLR